MGVYDKALCKPMAEVLGRWVPSILWSSTPPMVWMKSVSPQKPMLPNIKMAQSANIQLPRRLFARAPEPRRSGCEDAKQSLAMITDALGKQLGPNARKAADIIALNAGAALYVAGCAADINEGVAMAQDAIGSGLARAKITDLATFTQVQQDG